MKQETPIVPKVEFHLFGRFEVRLDDRPLPHLRSRREQWLLALLVLRHDRDTSRDWLAATLWPDNDEAQALFYLRKSLSNLRKALGAAGGRLLSPTSRTVRLDLTGAFTDVFSFDGALSKARTAANVDSYAKKAALEEAVPFYQGPLLPDCPEEWAVIERNQREQAYQAALESLAAITHEQGDPAAAVHWLRLLVATDPYRESAYCALMRALSDCGDNVALKQVFNDLRVLLRRELNATPSPETEALCNELTRKEVRAVVASLPQAAPAQTRRHLPVPLSDLIGRSDEIVEILDLLKRRRLISVIGPGGIGKTRIAIAVAERALSRFAQGVWFVDLAPISDPSLAIHATARALGITEEQRRPLNETLQEALKSQELLLVLDNCEHLQEAPSALAHLLLTACPSLAIIATSRHPLDVTGEQIYRLPSLPVPSPEALAHGIDPHALIEFEAIRLFADRAYRVNKAFILHIRNAVDVIEICRKLDGIPLAIEMAAARIKSLSVGEIRARLDAQFQLLTTGNRAALPRQQTLRATMDWSYDLLSEPEKTVLRRLWVFAGGCTLQSAAQVCGDEGMGEIEMLDILTSLVDKSLVTVEDINGATRYRLLEIVKQYARDRFAESGEEQVSLRIRHRDFFTEFAINIRPKLMDADQAHWFSILDTEHDNFRQALNLGIELPHGGQPGLRLAAALARFWLIRAYFTEGRERYTAITALPSAQDRTRERSQALNGAGLLAWRQSDYKAAQAHYAESISIARELGDTIDVGRALNNLALITRDLGDYASARTMHQESIEIFRASGDKLVTAIGLSNLGAVDHYQGDFAAARSAFEEGLAVQKEMGDRSSTSVTLSSLGAVSRDQGNFDFARQCHEEGLEIARELADKYGHASHLYGLGCCASQAGSIEEARSKLSESLRRMYELGEKTLVTDWFVAFASLARKEQRELRAVQLLSASAELRKSTGSPLPRYAFEKIRVELAELRSLLGEDTFHKSWNAGKAMSLEAAYEYALEGNG